MCGEKPRLHGIWQFHFCGCYVPQLVHQLLAIVDCQHATISGSKCVPAFFDMYSIASWAEQGRRYGRTPVIASNTSTMASIRAQGCISSPCEPTGYPFPSKRS